MSTRVTFSKRSPKSAARSAGVIARKAVPAAKAAARKGQAKAAAKLAPPPSPLKTIAADASTCVLSIPHQVDSVTVPSLAHAQQTYERLRNSSGLGASQFADGLVTRDGVQIARISYNGRAWSPAGMVIAEPQGTGGAEKDAPMPVEQVELEPAVAVSIPGNLLAAALAIAPKKASRAAWNAVFVHTVGDTLRVVAVDGHRMFVVSQPLEGKYIPWGEAGLLLSRDELDRIVKFIGQDRETVVDISFGREHPIARIADTAGRALFVVKPLDEPFPDYQKLLDSSSQALSGGERLPMDVAAVNSKYMQAAGAIAQRLKSETIYSFMPANGSDDACMFTFGGEPGALLVIMPIREPNAAPISRQVVATIGDRGMRASISALRAHQTRALVAAKAEKDDAKREELAKRAATYESRINDLQSILKALPAPKPDATQAAQEAAQAEEGRAAAKAAH